MSFSYTNTLPTDLDYIRFLLGDTTTPGHEIEDEEITGVLTRISDPVQAACAIAASLAAEAVTALSAADVKVVGRLQLRKLRDNVTKWKDVCDLLNSTAGATSSGTTAVIAAPTLVGVTESEADAQEADPDFIPARFRFRPPSDN